MRTSYLLASMATSFSFVHAADYAQPARVLILAPEAHKDVMKVYAKKNSEGVKTTMTRATDDPYSASVCGAIRDPVTQDCPAAEHAGVTIINFDRPTDQPRPIEVIFPDYTIKCTFAVNQAMDARLVAWYVNDRWDLDGRREDFKMVCDNATAYR